MLESWQYRVAWATFICGALLTALSWPAEAAEVRLEGNGLFFKAKLGETNTVVVTLTSPGGGPDASGVDVIKITDSSSPVKGFLPCKQGGPNEVTCEVPHPSFVSLDLGNKNDSVRQTDVASSFSIPMKIFGGLGNDTLRGGFAGDTIDGGPGNDTLDGDDGDDVITGGADKDQIQGGRGTDNIDGQLGNDVIDGGLGDDVIHGGGGDDTLTGGPGSDKLFGGSGSDTLRSRDNEKDDLDCGVGNDSVDRDSMDSTSQCKI